MEHRQLGGLGFLLANAALFANGLIANRFAHTADARSAGTVRMGSAFLWSGSAAFLAFYGDRPVAAQQARLAEKLAAHLRAHGVPLDAAAQRAADADARRGWFARVEDFFYAHPIELSNAYNAVAATGFAVSGNLRRREGNVTSGNANIGLSALTLGGTLASILIPERTAAQVAAMGQQGTLWGNVQQHPLGLARWLFLASDAVGGLSAVGEVRRARALPKGDAYRTGQFAMGVLVGWWVW